MDLKGDEGIGVRIVRRSLEEPLRTLVNNAGREGSIVVEEVKKSKDPDYGYNVATETYENLTKAGVIDPTKVTRTALQNASSIASLMLTTEAIITELPEKEKKTPPMPGGGGYDDMY
jgi:chaperonin GroEL